MPRRRVGAICKNSAGFALAAALILAGGCGTPQQDRGADSGTGASTGSSSYRRGLTISESGRSAPQPGATACQSGRPGEAGQPGQPGQPGRVHGEPAFAYAAPGQPGEAGQPGQPGNCIGR